MYCEQIHVTYDTESDPSALNSIMEFWTKITPGILSLLSQTKVVSERYLVAAAFRHILCLFSIAYFIFNQWKRMKPAELTKL